MDQIECLCWYALIFLLQCLGNDTGEKGLDIELTGRKNRALQVPLVVPYKALEKFSKALYGTTKGTCSARCFRPVSQLPQHF